MDFKLHIADLQVPQQSGDPNEVRCPHERSALRQGDERIGGDEIGPTRPNGIQVAFIVAEVDPAMTPSLAVIDGFIAGPDGDLSPLSGPQPGVDLPLDYGYGAFMAEVGALRVEVVRHSSFARTFRIPCSQARAMVRSRR